MAQLVRKVVFLDFDGVLNTDAEIRRYGKDFICSTKVRQVDRILRQTGAVVVVSSMWRTFEDTFGLEGTTRVLREAGLQGDVIDVTPDLSVNGLWGYYSPPRHQEIKAWLQGHPGVTSFVILDDLDEAEIPGHFVQTSDDRGLVSRKAWDAIKILRQTCSCHPVDAPPPAGV